MMGTCTVLSMLLPQGLVLLSWIWGCSMDMGLPPEEGCCGAGAGMRMAQES